MTFSDGGPAKAGAQTFDSPTPYDKEADTFPGLFFGCLAARVGNPWDGFDFALADRGRVKDQLWGPGETHRQPRGAHENPSDSWNGRA